MTKVIPLGEDAVEPMILVLGVVVYGVMANLCYTLGWVIELRSRRSNPVAARHRVEWMFRGKKKELDSYIEDLKARQRNLIWPDVLRGGRGVDELLWKGARDAPLVQRVGAVIVALAYLLVAGSPGEARGRTGSSPTSLSEAIQQKS